MDYVSSQEEGTGAILTSGVAAETTTVLAVLRLGRVGVLTSLDCDDDADLLLRAEPPGELSSCDDCETAAVDGWLLPLSGVAVVSLPPSDVPFSSRFVARRLQATTMTSVHA